jgi:hypothetical protein
MSGQHTASVGNIIYIYNIAFYNLNIDKYSLKYTYKYYWLL